MADLHEATVLKERPVEGVRPGRPKRAGLGVRGVVRAAHADVEQPAGDREVVGRGLVRADPGGDVAPAEREGIGRAEVPVATRAAEEPRRCRIDVGLRSAPQRDDADGVLIVARADAAEARVPDVLALAVAGDVEADGRAGGVKVERVAVRIDLRTPGEPAVARLLVVEVLADVVDADVVDVPRAVHERRGVRFAAAAADAAGATVIHLCAPGAAERADLRAAPGLAKA